MDVTRVRKDFPLFQQEKPPIYLDSACQSLRPRQVIDAMNEYYCDFPACGGRSVHRLATEVSIRLDKAREDVASFVGVKDAECVMFTKNATESMNTVAKGLRLERGDRVVTTDMEHNSNHVPWVLLAKEKGLRRGYLSFQELEQGNLEPLKEELEKGVKLLSVVHTNNVDGSSIPLKKMVELAHDHGALVMADGCQYAPHNPLDLTDMDVDLYAWSMHKMLGPSGTGILYGKREVLEKVEPLVTGGGGVAITTYDTADILPIPERFEAGLQNYAGIIGSGAAVRYLQDIGMEEISEHERRLNVIATDGLMYVRNLSMLGPADPRRKGGIFSFNLKGMLPHDVAMILDEIASVLIRSGMHCVHPYFSSHGLEGCARASFYLYNTEEELRRFIESVKYVAEKFTD
ncbi:MAG TPA: aminotransferase class V-fold PLP-dependent enzyme [Methanomassiliicoccales archaeon]|nr:aminotransferase class V-fold PLP-dependent enzyme [Methanomassiliicoccales archaeon]